MKKSLSVVIALAISLSASIALGEENQRKSGESSSLFGTNKIQLSGYGGASYGLTKIGKSAASLAGIRGGLIVNDSIVVGLAGYGLIYPNERKDFISQNYSGGYPYMNLGYGGLLLEYHFMPKNLVHFSVGSIIGGGAVAFSHRDGWEDRHNDHDTKKIFVAEPELGAYVNITKFCRLAGRLSYRVTAGANAYEFKNKDFSNFTGSVAAEFGGF